MKDLLRTGRQALAALALLLGGSSMAWAAVVQHRIPFGLNPGSAPITGIAFRLPAGNDFSYVGEGIDETLCIANAGNDCLMRDQGWQIMPTPDERVVGLAGPALSNLGFTSWAELVLSADAQLAPVLELDLVLFGGLQQATLGGYRWLMRYDSSAGFYRLDYTADFTPQWLPTWDQVFGVPTPGTLPLALAALALLAFRPRAAQGVPMKR